LPDIGSQAIDVTLGLIFVFFLLSIICSAIHELVATVLNWRAAFLEDALRRLLGEDRGSPLNVESFMSHPLIRQKAPESKGLRRTRRVPSYLAPGTFALALLDTLVPPGEGNRPARDDLLASARTAVANLPDDDLKRSLLALVDDAEGSVARFRQNLERWFDNTMARASGWYKRRTQWMLLVIALVVTLALGADSLQIGRTLWRDDVVRAAVVQQATVAAQEEKAPATDIGTRNKKDVADAVQRVRELDIPIGWGFADGDPRRPVGLAGWIGKVLGLLVTILALSLGAPFWFDLLGKVSRLRGTGDKPAPAEPQRTPAGGT
jgi:hypothetical protein